MADLRAQPEEHVPAGARVALELDRAEYFIGENVLAHFVLENAGSEPFTFTWGGDYRGSNRHRRLQVTAAREDGTPAEVGDRGTETLSVSPRLIKGQPQPGFWDLGCGHCCWFS